MDEDALRQTGIEVIGDVPWGTHFCQFYKTKQDLIDLLIPYFKAGLEQNEFCLWMTSEPFEADAAIRKAFPGVDRYLASGHIEIIPCADGYRRGGAFDADRVLNGWVEKLDQARARGFEGLRLIGNTFWLESKEWQAFTDYEQKVNNVIGRSRMMTLCAYSLDKCGASEIIDVVSHHRFALIKRRQRWMRIESAEQRRPEEALRQLTGEPEVRGQAASAALKRVIHDRDERAKELTCLYRSARLLQDRTRHSADLLQELVALLPPAWQYPEITAARITLDGHHYATPNFAETPWKQSAAFETVDGAQGVIAVVYLEAKPDEAEGPFLAEERNLINAVAESVTVYFRCRRNEEALARLASIVESTNDAVIGTTLDGIVTSWNPGAVRLFGYRAEDMLGRSIATLFPPDCVDEEQAISKRIARGETVQVYDTVRLRKDGSPVEVSVTASSIRDAAGLIIGASIIARDVTERKRAEAVLRRSEAWFKTIFEQAPLGIALIDSLTGHIYAVNARFAQIAGRTVEDMTRIDWMSITHPDDVQKDLDNMALLNAGTITGFQMEKRYLLPAGGVVWINMTIAPVTAEDPAHPRHLCMIEDVTERKRTEAEQARLLAVLENSMNEIYLFDADTLRFTYVNRAAWENLGYSLDTLRTLTPLDLKPEFTEATFRAHIAPLLRHERPQLVFQTVHKRANGTLYPVEVHLQLTGQEGQRRFAAIIFDITERKQMEAQAIRLERLATLGQLLGGLAHELRNPLFILTGHLQLLREKLLQREYAALPADLEKVESAAVRMRRTTERFLTLARPSQPRLEPCAVPTALVQTLEFLGNELMKSQIRVDTAIAPDLPLVQADPKQLQEVFLNLMMNAMQAMAASHGRGTLTVSARAVTDSETRGQGEGARWIEVRIQDDGPGILPEHRARLFEPFFSTKPPGEGTGLGLWTVRTIVTALKGTVTCESEVGRGATFVVRLPASEEPMGRRGDAEQE